MLKWSSIVSENPETMSENTSGMDEHTTHAPTELETKSEDMSGMDEHADHAPMVASSDEEKNDSVLDLCYASYGQNART